MGRHEVFHCPVGIVQPVEIHRDAVNLSIRTPPFQPVDSRHRQPEGREQPVHVRNPAAADDGNRTSCCRRQAGQQCVQATGAPDCIRAMGDLDQGAVEVEKDSRLGRPGRSWRACHARTIQRRRAVRKTWVRAVSGLSGPGNRKRRIVFSDGDAPSGVREAQSNIFVPAQMSTLASNTIRRCDWGDRGGELLIRYHDTEWGVPVYDDRKQFEFLILESAQAGLSWLTVLRKREAYREAFADFDPVEVARFGESEIEALLQNPGIIRNRLKIAAAVSNARAFLEIQREFGSFNAYIWEFVGGKPLQNRWKTMSDLPTTSPESDALSRDLKKRGFKFVGSTIVYAHMQATGMVNDHAVDCFRYRECAALGVANGEGR